MFSLRDLSIHFCQRAAGSLLAGISEMVFWLGGSLGVAEVQAGQLRDFHQEGGVLLAPAGDEFVAHGLE